MCKSTHKRQSKCKCTIHTSALTGTFSGLGYTRNFAIVPPKVNYWPHMGDPKLYLAVLSGKKIGTCKSMEQAMKVLRKAYFQKGPWTEDELDD